MHRISEVQTMTKAANKAAKKPPNSSDAEAHATARRASSDMIDRAHLARMTFGDQNLEAEVLRLFDRQCAMLVECIRTASMEAAAVFAHTLQGSCRAVGAWQVAQLAEPVESAARACDGPGLDIALKRLTDAVVQMRTAVAQLLDAQS
jgi:HPt (histidine-containing phosphotransfer) domain-containing protein